MKAVCILGSPRQNGNTAAIASEVLRSLEKHGVKTLVHRLGEARIEFCKGCMVCDTTGQCVLQDDVEEIVKSLADADLVLMASPSYWGDVTGQMKVLIDRFTPYCNTIFERQGAAPAAKGAAITVRAGQRKSESMRLVGTIEHFLGHLDIPLAGYFSVEGIRTGEDLLQRPQVLADAYAFGERLYSLVWGG